MRMQAIRALLLLIGCSVAAFAQTLATATKGTATVSGKVMVGEKPAAGVVIGLMSGELASSSNETPLQRATTDSDGHFQLTGIAAGRYRVQALAPGYVGEEIGRDPFSGGRQLSLGDGEQVEKFDFKLAKGGVITGKVTDATGRPLIAMSVRLLKAEANGRFSDVRSLGFASMMYQTNDLGEYRLYGLLAGRYTVAAGVTNTGTRAGRNAYRLTYHPDTTSEREAKIVEITPGSEAKDVDIRLSNEKAKGYTVLARVVDAQNGQPVAGVQVSFSRVRDDSNRYASLSIDMATTDGRGQARFNNVLPGRYHASLSAFMPMNGQSDYFSDNVLIEVGEGDVEGTEIQAQRTATLSGVMALEGVTDPAIVAKLSELEASAYGNPPTATPGMVMNIRSFKPQRDGTFRVAGLVAGRVSFSLNTRTAKGFSLARIELNGVPQQKQIEVTAGQQVTGLRLVFHYGTSVIRGQVQFTNGDLPADARMSVVARRADAPAGLLGGASAQVDARGRFVLEGLAEGEYEVRVSVFATNMTVTISSGGGSTNGGPPAPPPQPRRYPTATQKVTVPPSGETPLVVTYDFNAPLPSQPTPGRNQ